MFECLMPKNEEEVCKIGWNVAESLGKLGAKTVSHFMIYDTTIKDLLSNTDKTKEVHHFDRQLSGDEIRKLYKGTKDGE